VTAAAIAFLGGGLVFWQVDRWARRRSGTASNFTGMLLDFIPEAIALGAAAVAGAGNPVLLAVLIALQNMPEGFASQHEMHEGGVPARRAWMMLGLAPLAGPLAAWAGYTLFAEAEQPLAWLMLWCSGGILYLIFQDIAPQARRRNHDFPAVGAVSGFLLGMVGVMLLH
jgi:ZIP family zinc transporter